MRVDYLRDAPPDWIARAFEYLSASEMRVLLGCSLVALAFVTGGAVLGALRVHEARGELERLQVRVARSGVVAARVKAEIEELRRERAFQFQLLRSRASGARVAWTLAHIGNALPQDSWLTAVSVDGSGSMLDGRAASLQAVSAVLRAFASSDLDEARRVDAASAIMSYRLHYRSGTL